MLLLVVILAIAGAYSAYRYVNDSYLPRKQLEEDIAKAQELNTSVRPAALDEDGSNDNNLSAAQYLNGDTAAWITIPDTTIDYPVVQGDDNSYYLTHTMDGEYNQHGTPFLDNRCNGDFTGFTSIIYGHHFYNDDSVVFGTLYYFKDAAYLEAHPTARLVLPSELYDVRLFAYMNVRSDSPVYSAEFETDKQKEEYLDHIFENAAYTVMDRSELDAHSRLVLLSTCTGEFYEARGVLVGVIKEKSDSQ